MFWRNKTKPYHIFWDSFIWLSFARLLHVSLPRSSCRKSLIFIEISSISPIFVMITRNYIILSWCDDACMFFCRRTGRTSVTQRTFKANFLEKYGAVFRVFNSATLCFRYSIYILCLWRQTHLACNVSDIDSINLSKTLSSTVDKFLWHRRHGNVTHGNVAQHGRSN